MKHKKFKLSILLVLALSISGLQAQDAVVAAGGEATGAGGFVSYSIGQVAYITLTGTNYSVTEGVQQTFAIATTIGEEVDGISLDLMAYPNPTSNYLTLQIENYTNQNLSYQLYDAKGNLIQNNVIVQVNTQIAMQFLPAATYFLQVVNTGIDENQPIKVFRIIKN